MDFDSEIESVDKASRIDSEHIKKCICEINSEVNLIERELGVNSNSCPTDSNDR